MGISGAEPWREVWGAVYFARKCLLLRLMSYIDKVR